MDEAAIQKDERDKCACAYVRDSVCLCLRVCLCVCVTKERERECRQKTTYILKWYKGRGIMNY